MPDPAVYDVSPTPNAAFGAMSPQAMQSLTGMIGNVDRANLYKSQTAVEDQKLKDMQAAALKRQEQLHDLGTLHSNPNPADIVKMAAKYPELSEHFKSTFGMLDQQQRMVRQEQAVPVYASILSGKPEVAVQLLRKQAETYRAQGMDKEAQSSEVMAGLVESNPGAAAASNLLLLAHAMGPDKFGETFDKLRSTYRSDELQGAAKIKADADAQVAATKARFAESDAVMELQKKGWDITKIQSDISVAEFNKKIALINTRIEQQKANATSQNAATNAGQLELEKKKYENERDKYIRSMTAESMATKTTIDNVLNSVDQALNVHDKEPGIVSSAHGPISARLPTLGQGVADYEAVINQIRSQSFISQIQALRAASQNGASGLGNVTEKEGDKLETALQNLSLTQSPAQMKANLAEAQRILLKMRAAVTTKTGVPETIPDTPRAQVARGPGGKPVSVDEILMELGLTGAPK